MLGAFVQKNGSLAKGMSSQQQQGGGTSKQAIRIWTQEKDKALVESMLELRLGGTFNADNGLKTGSLEDLERKMESKWPGCGLKAIPHIQSRYKTLKATWKDVHDMAYGNNTSGFGWDPDRCMLTAEKDVWDSYIRSYKKCAPSRTKQFPLFDQLIELFHKDRANGKDAQSPADVVEELSKESET
ncbi:Myb/SANT-like domain containing protein [Senna tora]|uniref:Myb/SANT-like domain containing protein n=1 Tax=Senna tora TaxID=362788 RepID=A0A834TTS1_9FABA|nr:Myb/SANT-like domain containing protein [Senna tora]